MAEVITPRLMAAAKEFNIGKDTLVDFLVGKGFDKDELKPTAKLTEDMYRALQTEFQGDKVAKQKSVQIDLPKNVAPETRKKRDEEEIIFRKDERKVIKKEEPAPVEEIVPPVQEIIPEPEPVPAPTPEPIQPEPVIEPEPIPEPVVEPTPPEQPEIVKIDAPELESPKVLDKIDLSAIDSSTRPKKGQRNLK